MSHVEKLSVAVTKEMASMLRGAVATGQYASASELIREALRDWQQRQSVRQEAITELQRLWDEGIASGEPLPAEDAFARIKAKIDAATAR